MFNLVNTVFRIYEIVVMLRVLFSWIPIDWNHPIAQWIFKLTEPLLKPLRALLPFNFGIDLSPILLFLLLSVIKRMLLNLVFLF